MSVSRRDVLKGIGGTVAAATAGVGHAQTSASAGESVTLQYFHEDWQTITNDLDRVADRGYDAIWIQQPAVGAVTTEEQNGPNDPPLGYQPLNYRDFDSELGTEAELQTLIDTAHQHGIEVYLDTVLNHMAAEDFSAFPYFSSQDFHNEGGIPSWSYSFDSSDDRCYENGSPKDPKKIECDPWWVENGDLLGLKDLDHSSSYVRDQLKRYMKKMADMGADGYRFDAAKHIPESFFANYANQWAENWNMFRVGEVYSGSKEYVQTYVDQGPGMHAFDFPLYYTMQGVFSGGDMRQLQGAGLVSQDPFSAMPFVHNHDIPGPDQYELAHAFVLTIEGYPVIYNLDPDYVLGNGNITNAVWVKSNLAGGQTLWRYTDSDIAVYEREGNLLVGLNNSGSSRTVTVQTSWTDTELNDYAGNAGNVTTDSTGSVEITVPAGGWTFYAPTGQGTPPGTGSDDGGSSTTVTLQIEAPTADGESVFFTGNTTSLTDWGGGIEGTETNGVWEVTIDDPGSFEWKTRRGPAGASGDVWESGDNHTTLNPTHNGWEDGFTGGSESAPTAAFSYSPTAPSVGEQITFDASDSTDPDDNIQSYQWDFTGDGTTDATGQQVTHTFNSAGAHTVTLTVTDSADSTADDSTTQTVDVTSSTGIVDQYDADGDGCIGISELNNGISDYFTGDVSISQLNTLLNSYFKCL